MRPYRVLFIFIAWSLVAGATGFVPTATGADPQLLASSCSGCHSSSDALVTTIPRIRGLPEPVLLEALHAFRNGQRRATVMDRIAKGLTDDEIRQLAAYVSGRR